MLPLPSAESSSNLREEGALCRASLAAFTESVITSVGVSQRDAERLRKYDSSRKEGNVYFHFPFCFREAFATVALEDVRTIALSGILWMSYMRAQDDAIDKVGETLNPTFLFLRDLYLRESLHLLYSLFPHSSRFWNFYSTYFDEYARSVLCEKANHSSIESTFDDAEFHRIAKGKAAMAKYPVAALAVLSGEDEKMPFLTESLDCFHVGYQYWDDLVDWKEDLASSKYSLLLTRALEHIAPEMRTVPGQLRESIGRVIYYSGLAGEQLDRSLEWLERAYELSVAAGCTVWAAHAKSLQKQVVALASDLRSIMLAKAARSERA
jgi:hypothetical protein